MVKSRISNTFIGTFTYSRRILLLLLIFGLMLIFGSAIISAIKEYLPSDARNSLLVSSILQNLIMFIAPALLTAIFLSKKPMALLGLNKVVVWKSVFGILLIYIVGIPALNQVIYWNEHLSLPVCLNDLETTMRNMEESARSATNTLLNVSSLEGLLLSILVVGILTGFSEELFFRGALQRIVASNGMSLHLAVWIAAFVFSLLHFQFFGFLPRMLLGAFFGYLFIWTGSIWTAVIAHALNNSIVVISTYFANNGFATINIDRLGVVENGFPLWATISAVLVVVIFVALRKYLFETRR